jgi:protein-tyrosine kinase
MSIVEKALVKLQQMRSPDAGNRGNPDIPLRSPGHDATGEASATANRMPGGASPAIVVDLEELRAAGLLAPSAGTGQIEEQFRRLKWPLLRAALGKSAEPVRGGNVIAVMSALPEEGKTFVATNLALSLAQERDCAVVLVDADVAKRHLTHVLGLENRPGLMDIGSSVTSSIDSVVVRTNIPGLAVLPAGGARDHAPEVLGSQRFEQLIGEMTLRWPHCVWLFDCSPLLATAEPQVLARLVGQVLLVVRADFSPPAAITEAISLLDRRKPVSCVLNRAETASGPEGYYNYHYGADGDNERKSRG